MTDIRVEYGDTVYCSVDDVERYFRKEAAFTPNSNPSDEQVLTFIRDASDEIDRHTRHAWRENTVTEEYQQYSTHYRWDAGRPLMLNKMAVRTPLDDAKGDAIAIWDGHTWENWVANDAKSEGREGEYWLDSDYGQLWIYDRFVWRARPQLRVTYRYGDDAPTDTDTVGTEDIEYTHITRPRDIVKACSKLVAAELLSSDQFTQLVPGGEGAPSPERAMEKWDTDVYGSSDKDGLLARHKVDPAWVEPY